MIFDDAVHEYLQRQKLDEVCIELKQKLREGTISPCDQLSAQIDLIIYHYVVNLMLEKDIKTLLDLIIELRRRAFQTQ